MTQLHSDGIAMISTARRTFSLAAALWLFGALPAAADLTPDWFKGHAPEWNACAANPKVSDDDRIAGCTAIIQGGKEADVYLATAYQYRGNAYARKGDNEHAIQDYAQAIALTPESKDDAARATRSELFRLRGYASATKGDLDGGIQDFGEAIRLYGGNAAAFGDRGEAYYFQGKYDLAGQDLDQAITLQPRNAEALYYRALTKHKTGDGAGAKADLAAARAIDPEIGK